MKIIGLIAEYNPFHFGHIYQINKIKELYPDSMIIAIVSTSFTQRGDICILNKWDKTNICLKYGIDLVVELPTLFATQAADKFAYGALKILNELKIDTLVFGSESDDIISLTEMANVELNNKDYSLRVKEYMSTGLNYPTAMSKALYDIGNFDINKPNDLLGLSYIKEIIKNKYKITPVSIKRTNDYHEKNAKSNIVSANVIREYLYDGKDISSYDPCEVLDAVDKKISLELSYNYLVYNIINNVDKLNEYLDVDEGLENRLVKAINNSNNWKSLVMAIKSRRYTYNRVNRMLIHILLKIKKKDNDKELYLRILGFNSTGQKYLNSIKKEITIPVFTSYKPNKCNLFDLEFRCNCIYALITGNLSLIQKEYQCKPIIMK